MNPDRIPPMIPRAGLATAAMPASAAAPGAVVAAHGGIAGRAGRLACGAPAGGRMRPGLLLNDAEEDHDCFPDDDPCSHVRRGVGIGDLDIGRDDRPGRRVVEGPSPSGLVAAADAGVDGPLRAEPVAAVAARGATAAAEGGSAAARRSPPATPGGDRVTVATVDARASRAASCGRPMAAPGPEAITAEGSDGLGSPEAAFR